MITSTRSAIADVLRTRFPAVPVLGDLPDDLAEVPAIVVGRPTVSEGDSEALLDLQTPVWLIGRRIEGTGSDSELDALADSVLETFGGTRGVRLVPSRLVLYVSSVVGRTVNVGALTYSAYEVSVETTVTTCDPVAPFHQSTTQEEQS